MGTFAVLEGHLDELSRVYATECAPLVRREEGSVDCYLLEPTVPTDPAIVCTIWRTEADAQRYDSSGRAQEIVAKVRRFFAGPPTLKSYRARNDD
jgi:heme-degrading monooxygenase HmoA